MLITSESPWGSSDTSSVVSEVFSPTLICKAHLSAHYSLQNDQQLIMLYHTYEALALVNLSIIC
jgi:hypothetical protein